MSHTVHVRRQIGGAIVGALAGALLVIVLVLLVRTWSLADGIRVAQQSNAQTLRETHRTLDVVQSCTTPGRECFKRGQKQTSGAIADINRVSIYAAACADRPRQQTVEQIQACVIERLAQDAHRPPRP